MLNYGSYAVIWAKAEELEEIKQHTVLELLDMNLQQTRI